MNRFFCTGSLVFFMVQGAEPDALCHGDLKKKSVWQFQREFSWLLCSRQAFPYSFLPLLLLKMETENKLKMKECFYTELIVTQDFLKVLFSLSISDCAELLWKPAVSY